MQEVDIASINSANNKKWRYLFQGKSVKLIEKQGNIYAKCVHPGCEVEISVAKKYKNFNSDNFIDHIALLEYHKI